MGDKTQVSGVCVTVYGCCEKGNIPTGNSLHR